MKRLLIKIASIILKKIKSVDYSISYLENNPSKLPDRNICLIGSKGHYKWIYMNCPCGCGDLLTLSLMKAHKPNWKIKIDNCGRASLFPSVWKTDNCRSHFWIKKGKVYWVNDDERVG